MLKLQIDYNITHFAPSYPKIFSGERGTVLTYRFEKLMFQVLSAYKNSMKKFNGCLVTAIQKNFRIKNFFFKLEEILKLLLMKENQNPKIALNILLCSVLNIISLLHKGCFPRPCHIWCCKKCKSFQCSCAWV